MYFFNSAEYSSLEKNESFTILKTLIGRQYSFQKLTQFSQGNNVLHAAASNKYAFFQELHVFL
jgi:hypothetical protein